MPKKKALTEFDRFVAHLKRVGRNIDRPVLAFVDPDETVYVRLDGSLSSAVFTREGKFTGCTENLPADISEINLYGPEK